MTMVEAVAKAMWNAEGVAYGWTESERRLHTWEEAVEKKLYGVGPFRIFARAAIDVICEKIADVALDRGDEELGAIIIAALNEHEGAKV